MMKNNKYIKCSTKDIFTNEVTYCYINTETGEEINSSDPDLLNKLNNSK